MDAPRHSGSEFDIPAQERAPRPSARPETGRVQSIPSPPSEGTRGRRTRLLAANRAIIVQLARLLRGRGVPLADLIQEGSLALWDAIEQLERTDVLEFGRQARAVIWNRLRNVVEANDNPETTSRGLLIDAPEPDPRVEGLHAERIEKAYALLSMLAEDQGSVLRLRFGIDTTGPLTIAAVAQSLGISRQRVGALESRALTVLRRAVHRLRWTFPRLERV